MRILLFDIDGTLLITDSGGKGALERALADEFGLDPVDVDVDFAGRTDRSLLDELLQRNGIEPSDANQRRLSERYAEYLPSVLMQRGGRVLPGVMDLLSQLSAQTNLACYAMTGNLAETASHKLKHFGLLHFFEDVFGGDHDVQREALARRTAATIRDRHGQQALCKLIVIGDTPHDVRCGHAIGADVIAVCTGSFTRDALEAENPTAVYDDFADAAVLNHLLVGT